MVDSVLKDPILSAYQIDDRKYKELIYDISGFFRPISIRDQILRASAIIERAFDYKLIQPQTRPLLIIGGSIAGVVAAISSIRYGVRTVIIERQNAYLRFLGGSRNRFISLSQYDWPARHWQEVKYPWKNCLTIPVTLQDDFINSMMKVLEEEFFYAAGLTTPGAGGIRQNLLTPLLLTKFSGATVDDSRLINERPLLETKLFSTKERRLLGAKDGLPERYGMALSCAGFGRERTFIPSKKNKNVYVPRSYKGAEFWRVDVKNTPLSRYKTVICGGGDGALQDFLLLVTKKDSAREVFNALALPALLRGKIENEILYKENEAHRSELWLNSKSLNANHTLYHELQETHLKFVNKIFHLTSVDLRSFKESLRRVLVSEQETSKIVLVIPCDHFSSCYPLNRFLTLLILHYLKIERGQGDILVTNTEINEIKSIEHPPNSCGKYYYCLGKKHEVTGFEKTCVKTNTANQRVISGSPFEHVILRFGILTNEPLFGCLPRFTGLQTLPYVS